MQKVHCHRNSVWYYKARIYDPELGRFLQIDPIEYEDSPNLYAYVGNDPVNLRDPLGLASGWCGTVHYNDGGGYTQCFSFPDVGVGGGASGGAGGSGGGEPGRGGSGDFRNSFKDRLQRLPQHGGKCDAGQLAGQFLGRLLVRVGGALGQVGYIGTVGGTGVAAGGALTGNVPAAGAGAIIIARSAQIGLYGTLVTASGAALMAVSGSGKPAIVQFVTISTTGFIPRGLGRSTAKQILTTGLNRIIPEVRSCER